MRVAILMPVYDDWDAAAEVCRRLDERVRRLAGVTAAVYLVDDGSYSTPAAAAFSRPLSAVAFIDRIRLRRNLGHQRAIALGLAFLHEQTDVEAVLVMDADGEDKPDDAVRLIELYLATDGGRAIFAARRRRFEGLVFRAAYHLYRVGHRLLTGIPVEIGNFSILSRALVGRVVLSSEAWSHYSASVVKAGIPMTRVPMDRGQRLAGESRMDYVRLVTHGLSAISVFRELVGTRLLLASLGLGGLGMVALVVIAALVSSGRLPLDLRTAVLAALIVLITLQTLTASFALAFSILAGRDQFSFLPSRDYTHFVEGVNRLNGSR